MALNRKKSPELQALLAEQAEMQRRLREAERAQKAKEDVAKKAAAKNGAAYAGLVLDLFEELGVEPEHPRVRIDKNDREVEVSTDPNDELRLPRLREILERIIEEADPELLDQLKRDDDAGRDQRRDEREAARRRTGDTASTADDESDDEPAADDVHRGERVYGPSGSETLDD